MRPNLAFLLLFVIAGCTSNKVDTKAEGEKLMQVSRDWSKSAAGNDIDKTMSYWADTALLLLTGQPAIQGKQNIRQMVESTASIPGFQISWEPVSVTVSESGDLAYMIEKNQTTMHDSTGKPITKYGTAVTVWKKDGAGNWKNVVDAINDDPVVSASN